jgi:hypothetical protein
MGTGAMNYCWNCGRWSEIVYLRTICAECLNALHFGKMSDDEAPVSSRRRDTAVSPDDGRTRAGGAEALSARESVEVSLAPGRVIVPAAAGEDGPEAVRPCRGETPRPVEPGWNSRPPAWAVIGDGTGVWPSPCPS